MKNHLFILKNYRGVIFGNMFPILLLCASLSIAAPLSNGDTIMNTLTPEETRVILNKGTEAPFTGQNLHNKKTGTYHCRQCNAALYRSSSKFDSECGWPAFDDAIEGAVLRKPDADGRRVEIVCARCGGHLGHVFEGERFTAKNTRHCVNSISMAFTPEGQEKQGEQPTLASDSQITATNDALAPTATSPNKATAIFAGGCFWGVEDAFSKVPGVLDVVSGYTGGKVEDPSYDLVSKGHTGHAEAVRVTYDPSVVQYEQLARLFFELHDPTQLNRQGPDHGTQYRSALFYTGEAQKDVAHKLIAQLRAKGWNVVTEVSAASAFYLAEDYHQDFTERTGRGACHLRVPRFEQGPR